MRGLAVAAVAVALGLLTVAPASQGARRTCGAKSANTLARSRYMRVYVHDLSNPTTYYACLFRGGKPMLLGYGSDDEGSTAGYFFDHFRLEGRFVAWAEGSCGFAGCLHRAGVADVARRRKRTTREYDGNPLAIKATRSGHVALLWDEAYNYNDPHDYFVAAIDGRGVTELDRGPVSHLGLKGNTIRWRHAGQPRSARFAGHPRRR